MSRKTRCHTENPVEFRYHHLDIERILEFLFTNTDDPSLVAELYNDHLRVPQHPGLARVSAGELVQEHTMRHHQDPPARLVDAPQAIEEACAAIGHRVVVLVEVVVELIIGKEIRREVDDFPHLGRDDQLTVADARPIQGLPRSA